MTPTDQAVQAHLDMNSWDVRSADYLASYCAWTKACNHPGFDPAAYREKLITFSPYIPR